jgi:hypothetical protein
MWVRKPESAYSPIPRWIGALVFITGGLILIYSSFD